MLVVYVIWAFVLFESDFFFVVVFLLFFFFLCIFVVYESFVFFVCVRVCVCVCVYVGVQEGCFYIRCSTIVSSCFTFSVAYFLCVGIEHLFIFIYILY